jgi:hypothetical protein
MAITRRLLTLIPFNRKKAENKAAMNGKHKGLAKYLLQTTVRFQFRITQLSVSLEQNCKTVINCVPNRLADMKPII